MFFSEQYGRVRGNQKHAVHERPEQVSEHVVQCVWYDRLFNQENLRTSDGRDLKIISPGWWNHGEGPDFKGAQIEFNGRLRTGDVEIHLDASGWQQHGHDKDSRYDDVLLHVVLNNSESVNALTSSGMTIPHLFLSGFLEKEILSLTEDISFEDFPHHIESSFGYCAGVVEEYGVDSIESLIYLAGEWRMLFKAREMRERMDHLGVDQTIHEAFLYACGFSHFKHHFRAVARQLPYERAQQLGLEDALLLETALLQLSGLLPRELSKGSDAVPHFARLRGLRNNKLEGLRALPLDWKRVGVRPVNYPERRMAGAARLLAKTSAKGLVNSLDEIWRQDMKPLQRRRSFECLFPSTMGFWSNHCTWNGKQLGSPTALIGPGRIRSIIGNVFIPLGLALARKNRDRRYEERVFEFFAALPKEPENRILKMMIPRMYGVEKPTKLDFRTQQGLLQMFQDWCEPNPYCQNCRVIGLVGNHKSVKKKSVT